MVNQWFIIVNQWFIIVNQFKFDMVLSINYVGKFHDAISCDAKTS